jgi:cellulose synthase/poly-beta-1,6-N-acetylglucosamine synthase-like glycosyltransferase
MSDPGSGPDPGTVGRKSLRFSSWGDVLGMLLSFSPLPFAIAAIPSLPGEHRPWYVQLMILLLLVIIVLIVIYLVRHFAFTLNRLFGRQRHPYLDIDVAQWPAVTVVVPAHNEEAVIGKLLQALTEVDYPEDRLTVIPLDDRSQDGTAEIVRDFTSRHPGLFQPFFRTEGKPGKGAALKECSDRIETEIMLVFDADYIPGHGIIKQLVAPFFDPEVGAVMGRVVPQNVGTNLLTRILDLERAGGYQVDQQARMNRRLVPQYGGTVGGVRIPALMAAGGWNDNSLAEDTDATYRLLLQGWKTVYQNRTECYEEVPETWPNRRRQVTRWARGHNSTLKRYFWKLLRNRRVTFAEKVDGSLLLGVYLMSPILLMGWSLAFAIWLMGINTGGVIIILAVTCYSTLGNFATFFEVSSACRLDGSRQRIILMPFIFLGFLVCLFSVSRVTLRRLFPERRKKELYWHKTERAASKPRED